MDKLLTYAQAKQVFSSPALQSKSQHYPERYHGKVPLFVQLSKTVTSDIPLVMMGEKDLMVAVKDNEYPVWVNSNGAVAVIYPDGNTLGVKPDEFEVTRFHP